jgi:hypothetical protein
MSQTMKFEALRASPEAITDDVIVGCSIVTIGEALGHGVHLDESFIDSVYAQGAASKLGVKSRFGHPGMCSKALGTHLGRFVNFRKSEDGRRVLADLKFAESARKSPHGDLAWYVRQLAQDDPAAFGTSIVFKNGERYEKDGQLDENGEPLKFAVCEKLMACDFVDEPAANPDGLFSDASVAGKVTAFLDAHPEVVAALKSNREIADVIASYGGKVHEFLASYKETEMALNEDIEPEVALEPEVAPELPAEVAPEVEPEPELAATPVAEVKEMSAVRYRDYASRFGSAIADNLLDRYAEGVDGIELENIALTTQNDALRVALEKANAKITSLASTKEIESEPVAFQSVRKAKRSLVNNLQL